MTFGKNHSTDLKEAVTGSALEALLPQKYPFVFLSALTDVSDTEVTSGRLSFCAITANSTLRD